ALEGLRAGHLVDQVPVDINEACAVRLAVDHMAVPDLVEQGARLRHRFCFPLARSYVGCRANLHIVIPDAGRRPADPGSISKRVRVAPWIPARARLRLTGRDDNPGQPNSPY